MVTRDELKSHWNVVKNRLQQNWRELSDRELANFNGSPRELIGAIQRSTGASWQEVESFLANVMREGRSKTQHVGSMAEHYSDEASQLARDGYDQVAAMTAEYSKKLAQTVRRRPVESLAIAFGVGLVASAVVLLNNRRR